MLTITPPALLAERASLVRIGVSVSSGDKPAEVAVAAAGGTESFALPIAIWLEPSGRLSFTLSPALE